MDNNNNLTMLRYNSDAPDDHAKQMMESVVEYHVGDMVNRIQPGNLVMQLPDAELAKCPVFIMCTILGMISLCILLPENRFNQLMALQKEMSSHIKVFPRPHAVLHNIVCTATNWMLPELCCTG
jgi:CPSF A subunit region